MEINLENKKNHIVKMHFVNKKNKWIFIGIRYSELKKIIRKSLRIEKPLYKEFNNRLIYITKTKKVIGRNREWTKTKKIQFVIEKNKSELLLITAFPI